jgi:hypothetical protein
MTDERFRRAVARFDELNSTDPRRIPVGDRELPRELCRADWLTEWLNVLAPDASEPLRLAARCQHLMRFSVPRSEFPAGRGGYRRWRRQAAVFHAERAAEVLREVGYDPSVVEAVSAIVRKENRTESSDVQTMEDALCLAFLEHDLDALAAAQPETKMVRILRDTWKKMSARGRALAEELGPRLSPRGQALLAAALDDS